MFQFNFNFSVRLDLINFYRKLYFCNKVSQNFHKTLTFFVLSLLLLLIDLHNYIYLGCVTVFGNISLGRISPTLLYPNHNSDFHIWNDHWSICGWFLSLLFTRLQPWFTANGPNYKLNNSFKDNISDLIWFCWISKMIQLVVENGGKPVHHLVQPSVLKILEI